MKGAVIWAVQSSTIERVAHYVDEALALPDVLVVGFHGGVTYRYFGVPMDTALKLAGADSVGGFLSAEVKGQYHYDRLDVQEAESLWKALGKGGDSEAPPSKKGPAELIELAKVAVEKLPQSRAKSLVLTKLDEARLWLTEAPQ